MYDFGPKQAYRAGNFKFTSRDLGPLMLFEREKMSQN
jgi:hypothetical protein